MKNIIGFLSNKSGQSLLESMIALGVLITGFLGMLVLLSNSLGLYRVTSEQYIATYLASEGVEIVKNLLDSGVIQERAWGSVLPPGAYEIDYATDLQAESPSPYSARKILYSADIGRYGYGAGDETPFRRKIVIEEISSDEIRVNSIVDWVTRGGGQFSVNIEDHFMNWR